MEALRRYTNLAAVLHLLREMRITLLPPDTWDDLNDRRLLEAYRVKKGYESLLCLCFAQSTETYHHWKVFAPGTDGVCIVFDKQRLLETLAASDARHGEVKYYTVTELSAQEPGLDQLPFAKRAAYEPEAEIRVLWSSTTEKIRFKNFDFPIGAIDRLIINPWLPKALAESVKETIRSTPNCSHLEILQSTVTDGPAWKRLADRYA